MGTFHDDKGPLHGITVFAREGDTVYVGRCDTLTATHLVLHDADIHVEGQDGRSNDEYLQRAARFGIWKKHETLVVAAGGLGPVQPLGDLVRGGGKAAPAATPIAEAPAPATPTPAADDALVTLTAGAVAEVRRLLLAEPGPGRGLRLGVAGGGCSGLTYKVEFDARRDGDLVVPQEGFEVYLDRKSAIYLRGVTLDHEPGLASRGFQFRNPNATNTCGCGESFAV